MGIELPRGRDLGPLLVAWFVSLRRLIFEKDLGTSLLFFGLFVALLYIATQRRSWLVLGAVLSSPGAVLRLPRSATCGCASTSGSHPFGDGPATSYQIAQSLIRASRAAACSGRAWARASRSWSRTPRATSSCRRSARVRPPSAPWRCSCSTASPSSAACAPRSRRDVFGTLLAADLVDLDGAAGLRRGRRRHAAHPAHGSHHAVPRAGRLEPRRQLDRDGAAHPGSATRRAVPDPSSRSPTRPPRWCSDDPVDPTALVRRAADVPRDPRQHHLRPVLPGRRRPRPRRQQPRHLRGVQPPARPAIPAGLPGDRVVDPHRRPASAYLRQYSNGPLYAPATATTRSSTAPRASSAPNPVLSGSDDRFFVDRVQQLFAGRGVRAARCASPSTRPRRRRRTTGSPGRTGAVVAIDPRTGRSRARVVAVVRPDVLSSHNPTASARPTTPTPPTRKKPLLNRPLAMTLPPGSTFKLVTAAAAPRESGQYTSTTVVPGPASINCRTARAS